MHTFTDAKDRTWNVTIDVTAIEDVRDQADFDLLNIADKEVLADLFDNPVKVSHILYALCKAQADKHGVLPEDFGRGLAGDALEAALGALLEELVAFFPPRRRQVLQKLLAKVDQFQNLQIDTVEEVIDSGALDREMKAQLAEFTEKFTRSPGSSASTPDRSP